jgi:hypothetical protein
MKNIFLVSLTLLFALPLLAQNKQFQYAKLLQGQDRLLAESLAIDKDGNHYISGSFTSIADFDPGADSFKLKAIGMSSAFLLKLNSKGEFLWVKQFGGSGTSSLNNILIAPGGDLVLMGDFTDSIDVDPDAGQKWFAPKGVAPQVMILKLDSSGKLLWAKTFGNNYGTVSHGLAIEQNGNMVLAGMFIGKMDFDPGVKEYFLQANNSEDIFIQKLDSNGNLIWAQKIGNRYKDVAFDVTLDKQGNIFATGEFERSVDFDPGPDTANLKSVGVGDVFVLKLDSSGKYMWAKAFGGRADDFGKAIALDANGDVLITGVFSDTIDFDPGSKSMVLQHFGYYDIFVEKLDQDGLFLWAKTFGGIEDERVSDIEIAGDEIHVIGEFRQSVDFDPGAGTDVLKSSGRLDAFYLQLTDAGDYNFAKQISGTQNQWCQAVKVTSDNEVSFLGSFSGITDFDPSADEFKAPSTGLYNGFLVKLLGTDCGSLSLNVSLDVLDPKLTAVSDSGTYQWLNCDSSFARIAGQTSKSYTATKNGSYAVEVNIRGCKDTSRCVNLTKASAKFIETRATVNVYPNPTNGTINVRIEQGYFGSLYAIYDQYGQKVMNGSFQSDTSTINMNHLSDGIYLLHTANSGQILKIGLFKP